MMVVDQESLAIGAMIQLPAGEGHRTSTLR